MSWLQGNAEQVEPQRHSTRNNGHFTKPPYAGLRYIVCALKFDDHQIDQCTDNTQAPPGEQEQVTIAETLSTQNLEL